MGRTKKLTISLPEELVLFADEIAQKKNVSRSKIIALCLQELAEKQRVSEMIEGYIALADEQKEFVEIASRIESEVIPEW